MTKKRRIEYIVVHCTATKEGAKSDGKPKDTRTQKQTLYWLLKELKERYPLAAIVGHNDLNKGKACPCFDVKKEYSNIY